MEKDISQFLTEPQSENRIKRARGNCESTAKESHAYKLLKVANTAGYFAPAIFLV